MLYNCNQRLWQYNRSHVITLSPRPFSLSTFLMQSSWSAIDVFCFVKLLSLQFTLGHWQRLTLTKLGCVAVLILVSIVRNLHSWWRTLVENSRISATGLRPNETPFSWPRPSNPWSLFLIIYTSFFEIATPSKYMNNKKHILMIYLS